MEVIIFEKEAYYKMMRELHEMFHDAMKKAYEEATLAKKQKDEWLTSAEAMRELKIKSKNKLIKLRKEGCLKFSYVGGNYRYSLKSIEQYLTKNSFQP